MINLLNKFAYSTKKKLTFIFFGRIKRLGRELRKGTDGLAIKRGPTVFGTPPPSQITTTHLMFY